jgi:hypothetical protein
MVRNISSFVFYYRFYLVINKIKAKFVIGESKYVCGHYKIIWNLSPKCNNYIQIHFKITHMWLKSNLKWKDNLKCNTHM